MKTKIYTSIEQSKKLIELGIDVNTADMYYSDVPVREWIDISKGTHVVFKSQIFAIENLRNHEIGKGDIPAWSLSALLELIPPYLGKFSEGIDFGLSKSMNGKWYSAHYIQLNDDGVATFNKTVTGDTAVDACYEMIIKLKEQNLL